MLVELIAKVAETAAYAAMSIVARLRPFDSGELPCLDDLLGRLQMERANGALLLIHAGNKGLVILRDGHPEFAFALSEVPATIVAGDAAVDCMLDWRDVAYAIFYLPEAARVKANIMDLVVSKDHQRRDV